MCRITGCGLGCWEKEASTTGAGGSSKFTFVDGVRNWKRRAGSGYVLCPVPPVTRLSLKRDPPRRTHLRRQFHRLADSSFTFAFTFTKNDGALPGVRWRLALRCMRTGMRAGHRPTGGGACQARKRLLIRTSAAREWLEAGGCRAGVDGLPQLLTVQHALDEWSVRTVLGTVYTK